ESWEGVDRVLFEALRELRSRLAGERGLPAYLIFGDKTLRELARTRPSNLVQMRMAYGVGDAKLRDFGELFLRVIDEHCHQRHLSRDEFQSQRTERTKRTARTNIPRPNVERETAFRLFREGASIESVRRATGRALRTVVEYLCDYIRDTGPTSIDVWVAPETR